MLRGQGFGKRNRGNLSLEQTRLAGSGWQYVSFFFQPIRIARSISRPSAVKVVGVEVCPRIKYGTDEFESVIPGISDHNLS